MNFKSSAVIHPDGRRESNVEEFVDDSQAQLGYNSGGTSFSFSGGGGSSSSGAVAPLRHQSSSRSSAGGSSQRGGRF